MSAASAVDPFTGSRACFEDLVGWLEGADAAATLTHAQLEGQLDLRGRELLRRMFLGQLDRRALRESCAEVTDAHGIGHRAVESGHVRSLSSLFGPCRSPGLAYRHRGHPNLYAADGLLNQPVELHSHGIRRLAAIEASRGSFDEAATAIGRRTATAIGDGWKPSPPEPPSTSPTSTPPADHRRLPTATCW